VDSSLTRGFAGLAVHIGRRSCHDHDGRVILVGLWGCGSPIQEGPPLVILADVLLICAWCCLLIYTTFAALVPVLTLKSGDAVIGVIHVAVIGVIHVTPHIMETLIKSLKL
jgi:hypothetical protein